MSNQSPLRSSTPKRRDIRDRMAPAIISSWERSGSDDLAIFRIRRPDGHQFQEFKAGQYVQLAFRDQPESDPRPRQFSIASSPHRLDHLEFYAILVRNSLEGPDGLGVFTGTLWNHNVGDEILLMGPAGRFDLERTSEPEIFCIATGTGIAPFVSMAREMWEEYQRHSSLKRRITIIHGVSYARELGYKKLLEEMAADPDFGLVYVPTISRPDDDQDWTGELARGRANDMLRLLLEHPGSGHVSPALSDEVRNVLVPRLVPESASVYLCGNPDMIGDCKAILGDSGFRWEGRDSQVITEDYW